MIPGHLMVEFDAAGAAPDTPGYQFPGHCFAESDVEVAAGGGQPTMRRWGGIPGMVNNGINGWN